MGDGKIRIKMGERRQVKRNEELEVWIFGMGPLGEYLSFVKVPEKLKPISRQVAKIALGEMHAVFLFSGGELGVIGNNDRGQLGLPVKRSRLWDEDNFIPDLQLIPMFEEFENEGLRINDVAAGQSHTVILTQPAKYDAADSEYE